VKEFTFSGRFLDASGWRRALTVSFPTLYGVSRLHPAWLR
jgi:hypothetical protein